MGNLNIGNDAVAIKDVVRHVEKNIAELQRKRASIQRYAAPAIIQFYNDRIAIQQATLSWLARAL